MGMTREGEMTDLQFMQRPDLWPYFNLPMKRKVKGKPGYETGVLVSITSTTFVFVPGATIFEKISVQDPRIVHNVNLEGLVFEGWVVD